jgi:hypothetical protein
MADGDMKIVSMERTPEERAAAEARYSSAAPSGPDYPYGLCISLGIDEMKKLGIDKLPDIGQEFHIYAVTHVTSVNASSSEGGDDSASISLQITEMGVMPEAEEDGEEDTFSKAAKTLYGKAESAEGE